MKFSAVLYTGCLAVLVFFTTSSAGAYDPDAPDHQPQFLPSAPEEAPALPDFTGPPSEAQAPEEKIQEGEVLEGQFQDGQIQDAQIQEKEPQAGELQD